MSESLEKPIGTRSTDGAVHRRSPFSVADTVRRATEANQALGATLFGVVDSRQGATGGDLAGPT